MSTSYDHDDYLCIVPSRDVEDVILVFTCMVITILFLKKIGQAHGSGDLSIACANRSEACKEAAAPAPRSRTVQLYAMDCPRSRREYWKEHLLLTVGVIGHLGRFRVSSFHASSKGMSALRCVSVLVADP
jgi:hypothetical protein